MSNYHGARWEGKNVHSYVRDTGRTFTVRKYLQIPLLETLVKIYRKKGQKKWTVRVIMPSLEEVTLDTEDVDEAKAAAVAIWRMK